MDPTLYFAGFGGFMAGMLTWSRVMRWLLALWVVIQERRRDPVHRSRWRLLAAVVLHSGAWMLAVLIGMAVLILPSPHAPAWNTFFYGLLISLVFSGLMTILFVRKIRQRRAQLAAQLQSAK